MADATEAARARLDRALGELEKKVLDLKARPAARDDDLFTPRVDDRRTAELEAAAAEASAALARAADEIRALMGGEG